MPDVEGQAVTSYQWSSAVYEAVKTLGNPPKFYPVPISAGPVLAISTQSPLGAGSYLERCELYMAGSATLASTAALADEYQLAAINVLAIGEVYATGAGGIPDPRTGTNVPAAITAAAHMVASRGDAGTTSPGAGHFTTGGYVTSHAVRGPAKYGGGTPELRVGIYTTNQFSATWPGVADTAEVYHIRALWRI